MKTDYSDTIVICVLGATVVTYVGNVAGKKPVTVKPLIGGFVAGTLLLGVGMWTGKVAASFATIVLVTSILVNGSDVFKAVGVVTTGKPIVVPPATATPTTATPSRSGGGRYY